jgi:hypothetical protein
MARRIFIDRFSSLDDLPKKQYGDEMAVLRALAGPQRFSCFEMTQSLFNTIKRLEEKGYLSIDNTTPYPWTSTPLTDAGRAALTSGKRTP